MAGQPQPGDVVIRCVRESDARYVLSRYPGGEQFSFRTYDQALNNATGFAVREKVDVWYDAGDAPLACVGVYRSSEAAG